MCWKLNDVDQQDMFCFISHEFDANCFTRVSEAVFTFEVKYCSDEMGFSNMHVLVRWARLGQYLKA